jgi:flagellar assembly factor FliW
MTTNALSPIETQTPNITDIAITFPEGLVGCQGWKNFVLMTDDGAEELPVAVLQSLDDLSVRLMVTDPRLLDPSYSAPLSSQDRLDLELDDDTQAVLYCTISTSDGWLTANLLGPLVLNPVTRRGKQVIGVDSNYTTRHEIGPLAPSES